jgi:DNA-binding NtrC family response regulator
MMTMSDMIDVEDLPNYAAHGKAQASAASASDTVAAIDSSGSFEEHEKSLLTDALERAGGNQSEAARILRISRDRMRYKMAKYNLHQNVNQ